MTREELRDYVDEQRTLNNIPYHVYSALIDGIDTLEQEPNCSEIPTGSTTKNDLGVDCISRADAIRVASGYCHPSNVAKEIAKLPSVTPQEPQSFKWCTDCKEYDQEKHCCHRWSKVIRDTVEEMKQEQEPCDKCEVGNPCLYCKHEFEPQESEDKE